MTTQIPIRVSDGRGLSHRLRECNTAILADMLDFEALSLHDFSGAVLTPTTIIEALAAKKMDYFIWVATQKVIEKLTLRSYHTNGKFFISRVIDQLFIELASAIGDRVPGPCFVTVNPQTQNDILSLVEAARRLHQTFTEQGVPRELIVSIPATEEGILAAQTLEREGILTSLYLVTSLVHAQACVEAGVSAISVSARPLLDVYERKRKTVYLEPNSNPGIEAMQTIVAYFKHNNIPTTVTVTDFRNIAEIGFLSECDAVCVSEEQANRLQWSQVPTALHYNEQPQIRLRAEQAKYPTDLLTREGDFSTWFSPESRSLTMDIMHDALHALQKQMVILEHVVEEEIIRCVKLQRHSRRESSKMMEADMWTHLGWGQLSTASADGKEIETFSLSDQANNSIVKDEVF